MCYAIARRVWWVLVRWVRAATVRAATWAGHGPHRGESADWCSVFKVCLVICPDGTQLVVCVVEAVHYVSSMRSEQIARHKSGRQTSVARTGN